MIPFVNYGCDVQSAICSGNRMLIQNPGIKNGRKLASASLFKLVQIATR